MRQTIPERARQTLGQTAFVLRSLARTARRTRDVDYADRLERLARLAESGVERTRAYEVALARRNAVSARGIVRILLADAHELAREALRAVLNAHEGFLIVGEVGAGQELLQMLADSHPDLVIMDVRMPDVDAFAVIRAIRASQSAPDVILVTEEADRDVVLEALRAGVAAYLLKDASREELLATLCAVRAGQHRVQASLAADLLQAEAGTAQGPPPNQFPPAPGPLLSKREMDVLALVANGRKNDAIGRELGLSANTVKTHIKHIMRKLDSPDRAAAAAVAARMGLLEGLGLGA